jgi:hypothetical protein
VNRSRQGFSSPLNQAVGAPGKNRTKRHPAKVEETDPAMVQVFDLARVTEPMAATFVVPAEMRPRR